MNEQPNFYAIIPANVRYDSNLTPNAKLLYGEITALTNRTGYCWASNDYFSRLYNVSDRTIQNWLKSLEENGYIVREVKRKDGSKEVECRYIKLVQNVTNRDEKKFTTLTKKSSVPSRKKVRDPHEEKFRDNNTYNNTTNNTYKDILSSSNELDDIPYKKIIDYLNEQTGRQFRTSDKNKRLIQARFKEKFELDDFKKVIAIKTAQWKNDPNLSKYLRPETLFSNKFEGYLQEQHITAQKVTSLNKQAWVEEQYSNIF